MILSRAWAGGLAGRRAAATARATALARRSRWRPWSWAIAAGGVAFGTWWLRALPNVAPGIVPPTVVAAEPPTPPAGVLARWLGAAELAFYVWVRLLQTVLFGGPLALARVVGWAPLEDLAWQWLRTGAGQMGPLYVKFGQWLSLRPDLVGAAVCARLAALQSQNAAHSFVETDCKMAQEWGDDWPQQVQIWAEPIGVGCTSQVYLGTWKSGSDEDGLSTSEPRQVAIKMTHKGLEQGLDRDLRLLAVMGEIAELIGGSTAPVRAAVESFARVMARQRDLAAEFYIGEVFERNFETGKRGGPAAGHAAPAHMPIDGGRRVTGRSLWKRSFGRIVERAVENVGFARMEHLARARDVLVQARAPGVPLELVISEERFCVDRALLPGPGDALRTLWDPLWKQGIVRQHYIDMVKEWHRIRGIIGDCTTGMRRFVRSGGLPTAPAMPLGDGPKPGATEERGSPMSPGLPLGYETSGGNAPVSGPSTRNASQQAAGVKLMSAFYKMILVDNTIHADLHPGNVFVSVGSWAESWRDIPARAAEAVTRGAARLHARWAARALPAHLAALARRAPAPPGPPLRLTLLDCAVYEQLDTTRYANLVELFWHVINRDGARAARCLAERAPGGTTPEAQAAFVAQAGALIDEFASSVRVGSEWRAGRSPAAALRGLMDLSWRHRVPLDPCYVALCSSALVAEGSVLKLAPRLDPIALSAPFITYAALTRTHTLC